MPRESIFPILKLGPVGRLSIFAGALLSITLAASSMLPWAAAVDAGLLLLGLHPPAISRLLHPRRLFLLALLIIPPLFFLGSRSSHLGPISYSAEGLHASASMALRFFIILWAVEGLTRSLEIVELAALFERAGLKGLGFSLGVAMNLLPALQRSSLNAWQALKMRGGWRRQRARTAGLLAMTIISGALRRAEEIALAAEARAFSPQQLHPRPIPWQPGDKWMAGLMVVWVALVAWLR